MRVLSRFAAGAALFLFSATAQATEVKETGEINAAPDKVWAAIGDFCGIGSWHPAVTKCDLSEDKKTRILTLGNGATITETQEAWDDAGMSYSYRIQESPLPVQNYLSTIKVSGADGKSTIEWSSSFEPKGATEDEAKAVISGIYKAGFEGIAKKF